MTIAHSHPEKAEREITPPKTKTTYPCDENLRAEVLALRDAPESPWSNGRIASATRLNSSYISQYLNDAGNLVATPQHSLEPRLRIWLRDLKFRKRNFVPTINCPIADKICDAGKLIYHTSGIGIIIGKPGIGKTRGADLLVKSLSSFELPSGEGDDDSKVFATLIHVYEGKHTAHGLAEAIVADGKAGRPARGVSNAEHCFRTLRGSTIPIIIDDAHDLTNQAIRFLFRLREATGVPVIMLGTDKLLHKLRQDGQWLRRAGLKYILADPAEKKHTRALSKHLIEHHIRTIIGDVENEHEHAEIFDLCEQIVAHAGIFGSLHEQLFLAVTLKKSQPKWNHADAIRAAHECLIRDYTLN